MNLDAIVNSGQAILKQSPQHWWLINAEIASDFDPNMFSADFWQQRNAVTGTATGRGTTYFVQFNNRHWVLRHYYRGGLIGKIIHDSYWFSGLKNTRAIEEYLLLAYLNQQQLPAPKPIACQIIKSGMHYRADLISARIEHAEDLSTLLTKQTLSETLWGKIGETIAKFHQHQVYHHDLNIHNILIDNNQKIWLIDFDQGAIKSGEGWKQSNIERLHRSFVKEKNKNAQLNWQQAQWQYLLNGYQSTAI
ncbi:3-deoxy-D-manno-octulosonic acid kinase [Colwellia sp. MEBiC06753]